MRGIFVCDAMPRIPGMLINEDGILGIGPPIKGNPINRWF